MFVRKSRYELLEMAYTEATAELHIYEDVTESMKKEISDLTIENKNLWKLLHPKIKGQPRDENGRFKKK